MSERMLPHQKEACMNILKDMQHDRYQEKVVFFSTPVVDWFDLSTEIGSAGWAEYADEIKEPRDLGNIAKKVEADGYPSIFSFNADVTLCFNNAKNYNRKRNKVIFDYAVAMLKVFQNKMQKMIASTSAAAVVDNTLDHSAVNTSAPQKLTLNISSKKAKANTKSRLSNSSSSGPSFEVGKAESIMKVLTNLKSSSWFTQPIDTGMSLYLDRIAVPMDFIQIKDKIKTNKYCTNEEFARDVRRCFGNCLVFNYQVLDQDPAMRKQIQTIRKDTKLVMFRFEEEWLKHFGSRGVSPALPELKDMLYAIEEGMRMMSTYITGVAAIESFMSPVAMYYINDPHHMEVYNSVITHPMDYGHIISTLIEAQYKATEEVLRDCTLVADNCCKFYASQNKVSLSVAKTADGVTADAYKVLDKITRELEKLRGKHSVPLPDRLNPSSTYISSSSPPPVDVRKPPLVLKASSSKASSTPSKPPPSHKTSPALPSSIKPKKKPTFNAKEKYLWCLKELKAHTLDNGIQTCWPFLKAVDTNKYTDYFEVVSTAMDLSLMEKKINRDRYPDMASLWRDMDLTRKNCHAYSKLKGFADLGFLADLSANVFKYLLRIVAKEVEELGTGDGSLLATLLPTAEDREVILNAQDPPEVVAFYDAHFAKQKQEEEKVQEEAVRVAISSSDHTSSAVSNGPVAGVAAAVGGNKLRANLKQPPLSTASASYYNDVEEDETPLDPYYPATPLPPVASRVASKGSAAKKSAPHSQFSLALSATVEGGGPQKEAWELACYDLLKKLSKHEFIDTTKAGKPGVIVVDFFHPVVELYPSIKEAYLEVVSQPMDFTVIYDRLDMRGYLDAEDLFLKVLLIFQNSVAYNSPAMGDNDYIKSVVLRCEHMIKYVTWLAHEMLPCIDDSAKEDEKERQAMGTLRLSLRDSYRLDRLAVIENSPILSGGRECHALIKKFEIRKYNKELCYFIYPVEVSLLADYSIHIRHPMCFQTLKEKLDNSFTDTGLSRGGGGNSYTTYGQFLKDLRLIFKNAKTYCAVHMEADEISRTIYDSAVMLGDLMEGWISKEFSVDIAEKVLMHQIKSQEEAALEAVAAEQRRLVEEADEAYRKEQLEYLFKVDPIFAADQLKRQASVTSISRGVSNSVSVGAGGSSGSGSSSVPPISGGLVSLPSGDLASIEEMSGGGEGVEAVVAKKRKRDDVMSESEGEEYTEEGASGDDGDEEYKDKVGGRRASRGSREKSTTGDKDAVPTEGEDEKPLDVFDQYEVTQALVRKHEEILQIRQQGAAAVLGEGVSAGGEGRSVAGGLGELQAQRAVAASRRRTCDAVWTSFGLPRGERRGRRRRGDSKFDYESDGMSEYSDCTMASTSTTASPMRVSSSSSSTTAANAAAAATMATGAAVTAPPPKKGEEEHSRDKDMTVREPTTSATSPAPPHLKTGHFIPNMKRKRSHTSLKRHRCILSSEGGNVLSQYFPPLEEANDELTLPPPPLQTVSADGSSQSVNNEGQGVGGEMDVDQLGPCIDISPAAEVARATEEHCTSQAVKHLTTSAMSLRGRGKRSPTACLYSISVPNFLSLRPFSAQENCHRASSSQIVYSILPPSASKSCGRTETDLFVPEKIFQMKYHLQSGACLVQILVPMCLLDTSAGSTKPVPVQEALQGTGSLPPPLPSLSSLPASSDTTSTVLPLPLLSASSVTITSLTTDQFMPPHQQQQLPLQNYSQHRSHLLPPSSPSSPSSSLERERILRKNLLYVDEILQFVRGVKETDQRREAAEHPLQYQKNVYLQQRGGWNFPEKSQAYVDISPCTFRSDRNGPVLGVRACYRKKSLQLQLRRSTESSSTVCGGGGKGRVQSFISNHGCDNSFRDTLIIAADAVSRHGPSQQQEVVVHSLDTTTAAPFSPHCSLYSLRASLPTGVTVSTRLVAASGTVLVSQLAEKVSLQTREGSEVAYMQVWVLADEQEALMADLVLNTSFPVNE